MYLAYRFKPYVGAHMIKMGSHAILGSSKAFVVLGSVVVMAALFYACPVIHFGQYRAAVVAVGGFLACLRVHHVRAQTEHISPIPIKRCGLYEQL